MPHSPHAITGMSLALAFLFALAGNPVSAQSSSQNSSAALSPSEAYKAAMAPFNAARAQPDDLTDADKFALQIGIARAARDCQALSASSSPSVTDAKELLALGELCIFGQQYEPARATLAKYLALPQPPERKLAIVLLIRALLGLNEPDAADPAVQILLHDYPYDAQTHYAIDQIIDGLEGSRPAYTRIAMKLCAAQNAATLPLLASGKGLEAKEISASPGVLFGDAVRCAAVATELGDAPAQDDTQDALRQLTAIAQQPNWAGTADLALMQAALARQTMVGQRVPLASLRGYMLSNGRLVPRTVLLRRGRVLLLPFALWSPSAQDAARGLAALAPQQPIYAITSWAANTGAADAPSSQILSALRLWQQSLPPHVSLLIVPDAVLSAFHADTFPAGVAIRAGVVRSNSVISSRGAERMVLHALGDIP